MEEMSNEILAINQNRSITIRDLYPLSRNLTNDQNKQHNHRNLSLSPFSPKMSIDEQNTPLTHRNVSPFSLRKTILLLSQTQKTKYMKKGTQNKKQNFYCINSITQADTSDVSSFITKKNTINISNNHTPIKRRKKKVEFVANFKLVTKIYYDPNEPLVNMNKNHSEENKNKNENELKDNNKENLESKKLVNNKNDDRVVIKENVLCCCLIY